MSEHHGYFPKSNTYKYFIFLASIALFLLVLFFVYPNFITLPEFNIDQTKISNQPVIFESKKNRFWVEESGTRTYSKEKNGVNYVNLGRRDGKKTYVIGGYNNIGPFTIDSNKSYLMSLERDYTTLEGDIIVNRYYPKIDNPNYSIEVNTNGRKYLKLEDNNKVLYETNTGNNICNVDESNNNKLKCPIEFVDDQSKVNLFLSDNIGNRVQIATDQLVSLVPNISFQCDYKDVELNKAINCTSNKNAKVTYLANNQVYDLIPQKQVIIPIDLVDGSNLIQFSILDEHGFTTQSELKLKVQKLKNI